MFAGCAAAAASLGQQEGIGTLPHLLLAPEEPPPSPPSWEEGEDPGEGEEGSHQGAVPTAHSLLEPGRPPWPRSLGAPAVCPELPAGNLIKAIALGFRLSPDEIHSMSFCFHAFKKSSSCT